MTSEQSPVTGSETMSDKHIQWVRVLCRHARDAEADSPYGELRMPATCSAGKRAGVFSAVDCRGLPCCEPMKVRRLPGSRLDLGGRADLRRCVPCKQKMLQKMKEESGR